MEKVSNTQSTRISNCEAVVEKNKNMLRTWREMLNSNGRETNKRLLLAETRIEDLNGRLTKLTKALQFEEIERYIDRVFGDPESIENQ